LMHCFLLFSTSDVTVVVTDVTYFRTLVS